MSLLVKRLAAVSACVTLLCLLGTYTHAADAPATGSDTITGTVTGPNGPASGVTVKLYLAPAAGATSQPSSDAGEKPHHRNLGTLVTQATTDSQGSFSFPNLADGTYNIVAGQKGSGMGHGTTTLGNGTSTATVDITLKSHKKPPAQ
jgi:hypothetical protein